MIATTDSAGNLRLMDVATLREIGGPLHAVVPPLPAEFPRTFFPLARFTPDGRQVVVADDTGRAWVFPTTAAAWQATACHVAGRSMTPGEWKQFVPDAAFQPVCGAFGSG
jgi:hypothetical protein